MTVHLVKMAVGIDDLAHLATAQRTRLAGTRSRGGRRRRAGGVWMRTRNTPRRAVEVLDGGSLYWVVKGQVRARQRILEINQDEDAEGRKFCLLELDPSLVETFPKPCRSFQGWRYLDTAAAPADCKRVKPETHGLPPKLAAELRALGLV